MLALVFGQFSRRRIVDKPIGIAALRVKEAKIKTKKGTEIEIEIGIGIARLSKRNSRIRVRTTFQSTITRIV